ncbi:MAG: SAM-dependent methyltransferase [Pirellulales bacterium]|jgi:23S rRNA (cytidine2498-2'-O)-methyltransferase
MNAQVPDAISSALLQQSEFVLVGCRPGSESALEHRQRRAFPSFQKSYWRKGLVTFRIPSHILSQPEWCHRGVPDNVLEQLVFARIGIRSLGQITGQTEDERIAATHSLLGTLKVDAVHVWKRDPRLQIDTESIQRKIAALHCLQEKVDASEQNLILNCVVDSVDRWWIGWHVGNALTGQWQGGYYPGQMPDHGISRAWLKLDEAIARFGIEFHPGERVCELGAAPGGACQRLLEAHLKVVGVDPATMHPQIAGHEQFTHWRKRARDVRIRDFADFDWILTDMNIDPANTMASLERILSSRPHKPRGIIATLKLSDLSHAEELDRWCSSYASWGYQTHVQQLSTGGQEVCLVAQKQSASGN